jgi:hypothetical protein
MFISPLVVSSAVRVLPDNESPCRANPLMFGCECFLSENNKESHASAAVITLDGQY